MTFPTTTQPKIPNTDVFPPDIALALNTLAAQVIADLGTLSGAAATVLTAPLTGASTSTTKTIAIPAATTSVLTIDCVAKVTTRTAGSEAVGDSNHVKTTITVKNTGGTVTVVPNITEVTVTDQNTTMPLPVTQCQVVGSGANAVLTLVNPAGLNGATVVTHTAYVSQRNF